MFKWLKKHWGKVLICATFLALFACLIIFGSIPGLATAAVSATFFGVAFPTVITTASTFVQTLVLTAIITPATPLVLFVAGGFAFGIKAIFDCFSNCCGRRNPDRFQQQINDEIMAHTTTQPDSSTLNTSGYNQPYNNGSYANLHSTNNNSHSSTNQLQIEPTDLYSLQ